MAHSREAVLEEQLKLWHAYRQLHDHVAEAVTRAAAAAAESSERPASLAAVKSSIARVDAAAKNMTQKLQPDVDR